MTETAKPTSLAGLRRALLDAVLAPHYLILALGLPLAFYLLFTTAGLGGPVERSIAGPSWAAYFMVSMASLAALAAGIGVAATLERQGGPATGAAAAFVLALPALLVIFVTAAVVNHVGLPAGAWLIVSASLWVGTVPFVVLGLLIGSLVDVDTSGIVVLGTVVVLALLGGLLQPVQSMPGIVVAIAHVLPSYHLAALGWTVVVGGVPEALDLGVLAGYTVLLTAMLRWCLGNEAKRADD
jgi:ABC-2 type transport system permease protein